MTYKSHLQYLTDCAVQAEKYGRIREAQIWRDRRWQFWDLVIERLAAGQFSGWFLQHRVEELTFK